VAAAAMFLKDSLGQIPVEELISNLAKDKGKRLTGELHKNCVLFLGYIKSEVWV
jgi:hypothetical protein